MAVEGKGIAQHDGSPGAGVLRRLLSARSRAETGAGKAPQLPQPAPPTPARAAATAVGRAADRLYGLGVQPLSVSPGALTLAELPELLPQPALLVVLQGPGDLVGVAALCPETVTALIEIQTMGRVTSRPVERRRLTRSDAMISADFVNGLMAELAEEMTGVEGFEAISGYRYATYLDDPRPLTLMLEDKPYRSLSFELRMGGSDTRDSRIFIALPQPATRDRKPDPRGASAEPTAASVGAAVENRPAAGSQPAGMAGDGGRGRPDVAAATSRLSEAVRSAPVDLVGVLCRKRMTLGELRGLAAGKLLHLPRVSLSEARVETRCGQLLATGKFGEAEGCHAIRLHDPEMPRLAGTTPRAADPLSAQGRAAAGTAPAPIEGHALPIGDLDQPDAFRSDAAGAGSGSGDSADMTPATAPKAVGRA